MVSYNEWVLNRILLGTLKHISWPLFKLWYWTDFDKQSSVNQWNNQSGYWIKLVSIFIIIITN